MDKIVVLDFGGQYAHLIANRVRRLGVYSEIKDGDASVDELREYKGIILSGGPASVNAPDSVKCDPGIYEMGIPVGVVINRSTIGKAPVREFCQNNNIPILLEIPFERVIAEKYSNGELLIDIIPELHQKFTEVLSRIVETVQEVAA